METASWSISVFSISGVLSGTAKYNAKIRSSIIVLIFACASKSIADRKSKSLIFIDLLGVISDFEKYSASIIFFTSSVLYLFIFAI
jgi:hypothetical protein